MQNHVHLLPRFKSFDLPAFMRQLLSEYAHYYNKRHDHVGHVFQSRYGSVPINDDDQLLTVVRYIHQNPKDMGFPRPGDYKWSSYREYIGSPFITDTSLILDILGGIEPFIEFHETCDDSLSKVPFDNKRRPSIPDDKAVRLAKSLAGCKELSEIASCQKPERDARLALLKDNGFTIAQIARLTGIGRNIIQCARQPWLCDWRYAFRMLGSASQSSWKRAGSMVLRSSATFGVKPMCARMSFSRSMPGAISTMVISPSTICRTQRSVT